MLIDALVKRVQRNAYLGSRGPVYTVDGALLADATTIVLNETPSHIGGQGVGAIVSIDYELFYVTEVNTASKTLTVIPGYYGTTPAAHDDGSFVEIDPRMPHCMLLDFAQEELQSWGKELFRVTTVDVDTLNTHRAYDLGLAVGEEVYFLLDVRARPIGSQDSFWNFSWTGDGWPHVASRLIRDMPTADFASGISLQTLHPMRTTTLRVALAQPFNSDPWTPVLDLENDVGLRSNWIEILSLGMRYRALQSLVMGRVDWRRGSMSRAADEVSVFDIMRSADQARAQRDMLFTKAGVDLRAEWPYRDG